MYSSLVFIRLRNASRKLGINRLLSRLLPRGGYEDRFGSKLLERVRAGDTVWDVGANVGLYTLLFAKKVGGTGRVAAFEPAPACYEALRQCCYGNESISVMNIALGAVDGLLPIMLEGDPLAPTHRIIDHDDAGSRRKTVLVEVRSAKSVVEGNPNLFPNVIKIDVEGYEGMVLAGLTCHLADLRLRCIGVEVHFGILEQRGEGNKPKELESALRNHGFRVSWTDPSHMIADR